MVFLASWKTRYPRCLKLRPYVYIDSVMCRNLLHEITQHQTQRFISYIILSKNSNKIPELNLRIKKIVSKAHIKKPRTAKRPHTQVCWSLERTWKADTKERGKMSTACATNNAIRPTIELQFFNKKQWIEEKRGICENPRMSDLKIPLC